MEERQRRESGEKEHDMKGKEGGEEAEKQRKIAADKAEKKDSGE
jgi:hypothetical protein